MKVGDAPEGAVLLVSRSPIPRRQERCVSRRADPVGTARDAAALCDDEVDRVAERCDRCERCEDEDEDEDECEDD